MVCRCHKTHPPATAARATAHRQGRRFPARSGGPPPPGLYIMTPSRGGRTQSAHGASRALRALCLATLAGLASGARPVWPAVGAPFHRPSALARRKGARSMRRLAFETHRWHPHYARVAWVDPPGAAAVCPVVCFRQAHVPWVLSAPPAYHPNPAGIGLSSRLGLDTLLARLTPGSGTCVDRGTIGRFHRRSPPFHPRGVAPRVADGRWLFETASRFVARAGAGSKRGHCGPGWVETPQEVVASWEPPLSTEPIICNRPRVGCRSQPFPTKISSPNTRTNPTSPTHTLCPKANPCAASQRRRWIS